MSFTGIICEFNTFHNGHRNIIEKAKAYKSENQIILIMSGDLVQRGEIAVFDKFLRSKIAISCGADLVIELPSVFSTGNAEVFSSGAIRLLSQIKDMDTLVFGSECGDIEVLENCVDLLSSENSLFKSNLKQGLVSGNSFCKARTEALSLLSREVAVAVQTPNNVLGMEYIKALRKFNSTITPITFKRDMSEIFKSATEIRQLLALGEFEKASAFVPKVMSDNFDKYLNENSQNKILFNLLKFKLLTADKKQLENIKEVVEGLHNKILYSLDYANSYDEFLLNIKSKRYTMAKIKRILLSILVGITKDIEKNALDTLNYGKVLAVRKSAIDMLSLETSLHLIKKTSDLDSSCAFQQIDKLARDLFLISTNQSVTTIDTHQMLVVDM